jgi:hypothetical protein
MNQNEGAMNNQSMVKTGDQPRATQRDLAQSRAPATMSYVRNTPRGAYVRNNAGRSTSR